MSSYEGHFAQGAMKPWPAVTSRGARVALGMRESSIKFIEGALSSAGIRTISSETSEGRMVTLYNEQDVEVLALRLQEATK